MTLRWHGATLILLAGAACSAPSTTPPPAPAPSPIDLTAGTADTPDEPEEAAVPASASRSAEELARRLLTDHDIALHDATRDAVVYATRWSEEGTGDGLRVEEVVAGGAPEALVERLVGEPPSEDRHRELARKLGGRSWMVLDLVPWPDAATPLSVPARRLTASFDAPTLRIEGGGKEASASIGPPSSTPHLPSPTGLYVAVGSDVVVVRVAFDPGGAYGQGFNHYDEHRVMRLQ